MLDMALRRKLNLFKFPPCPTLFFLKRGKSKRGKSMKRGKRT